MSLIFLLDMFLAILNKRMLWTSYRYFCRCVSVLLDKYLSITVLSTKLFSRVNTVSSWGFWRLNSHQTVLIVFSFNHFSAMWYFIVILLLIFKFCIPTTFCFLLSSCSHPTTSHLFPLLPHPLLPLEDRPPSHGSHITSSWF